MANPNQYDTLIDAAAKKYNLPSRFLKSVMLAESGGNQYANANITNPESHAAGPMQIQPDTARTLGVKNVYDPAQAIEGGAKLLAQGVKATGNLEDAYKYYFSGALDDSQGKWSAPNTQVALQRLRNQYFNPNVVTPPMQTSPSLSSSTLPVKASPEDLSGAYSMLNPAAQSPTGPLQTPASPAVQSTVSDPALAAAAAQIAQATATDPDKYVQKPMPDTGDTIYPTLRAGVTQDPNYRYASVLPIKQSLETGKNSPAIPGFISNLGNGVLDLIEGPVTGVVTPAATNALQTFLPGMQARAMTSAGGIPPGWNGSTTATTARNPYQSTPNGPMELPSTTPNSGDALSTAWQMIKDSASHLISAKVGGAAGAVAGNTIGGPVGGIVGGAAGAGAGLLARQIAKNPLQSTQAAGINLANTPSNTNPNLSIPQSPEVQAADDALYQKILAASMNGPAI